MPQLPIWAMCLALIWMWFIPYFTEGALMSIYKSETNIHAVTAKTISLIVGILWPFFVTFGLLQLMFDPKK